MTETIESNNESLQEKLILGRKARTEANKLKKFKTLSEAVKAKCRECIYDPYSHGCGTWREQVQACTSYSCPLYEWRPLPHGKTA